MAAPEPKIEMVDGAHVPGATRIVDECYKYTDNDQIGEGTYGKVYKGTDNNGEKVALKMIRMDNEKEGFPITAIREIKLLSTLKHENIVNLREIVRSRVHKESKYKGDIFMVFDYAEHDLTGMMDHMKAKGGLSAAQIKCIMSQLLKGLAYCHMNGILHRDLKASNLLIDARGTLKIADFGLARNFANDHNGKLTNRVITLWYRPPELLLGAEKYGPEVDVWSVGCIFAELLAKKPLFPGNNEQQQLDCIFRLMGAPSEQNWPGVSELEFFGNVKTSAYKKGPEDFDTWCRRHNVPTDAIPLLKGMLQLDPSKRLTSTQAALHPYFYDCHPPACKPGDLPRIPDCHEWTTKKRKQQQQQQQQHHHQQHQQHPGHSGHHAPQHYGSMGHHPHSGPHQGMGGGVPGGPYSMPGVAAAAAAAGGSRVGYGSDTRNVRPRPSGAGYQPIVGGFNPNAAGMPAGRQGGYASHPGSVGSGYRAQGALPMAPMVPGMGGPQQGQQYGRARGPYGSQQQQQQHQQQRR